MAGEKRTEKKHPWVWLLTGLVLIAALAAVMAYRAGTLRETEQERLLQENERYSFETGAQQAFAAVDGGVAVGSSTGLQILDSDGYTVARSVVSVTTPALTVSGTSAAVYDVGGTILRVGDSAGTVTTLDTADTIISANMNDAGWMALVTEETGYKGKVTVYNAEMQPVYYWHSGNYVLSARISPDCRTMAALTMEETGSAVHIFSLSSETEYAVYRTESLLLFDMDFLGNDRLCAVQDGGLVFFTTGGADDGSWSFDGRYLSGYSFGGDGFVTVLLSQYLSGNTGEMCTVTYGGTVTGQLTLAEAVQNVSVREKQIAVRYGDSAAVYNQVLEEQRRASGVQGARNLVLTEKDRGFLLYSGYCEPLNF